MARQRQHVDNRLDTPGPRRRSFLARPRTDPDRFGRFAEAFARRMGTANFIFGMTVFIIFWVILNMVLGQKLAPDYYPFILLNLFFSVQASYASPLILLATNRQEARDRISLEADRKQAAQSKADMEYLAREIASLRMRMGDMATRDFIRSELRSMLNELDRREVAAQDIDGDETVARAVDSHGI
ncbi:MAG: DUF1003 domain-containing protein [Propionibacteriaceae bacterium]|jgi:uncharacterized membrane protein|nr:DUF1003 domain-containing protein [Propionibacteriaceae bacterium]